MIEECEIKVTDNVKSPVKERSSKMAQEIFDLYFSFVNSYKIAENIIEDLEKKLDYGEMFDESVKLTDKQKETIKRTIATNIQYSIKEQKQKYRNELFESLSKQEDEKKSSSNIIANVKKILSDNLELLFTEIGDKFDRGCFVNGVVDEIKVGKKLLISYSNPDAKITSSKSLGVVIATTNVVEDFKKGFEEAKILGDFLLKKVNKVNNENGDCEKTEE